MSIADFAAGSARWNTDLRVSWPRPMPSEWVVLGAVTPTHGEHRGRETLLDLTREALILFGPGTRRSGDGGTGGRDIGRLVGRRTNAGATVVVRHRRREPVDRQGRGIIVEMGSKVSHSAGWRGTSRTTANSGYMRAMKRTSPAMQSPLIDGGLHRSSGNNRWLGNY